MRHSVEPRTQGLPGPQLYQLAWLGMFIVWVRRRNDPEQPHRCCFVEVYATFSSSPYCIFFTLPHRTAARYTTEYYNIDAISVGAPWTRHRSPSALLPKLNALTCHHLLR